MSLGLSVLICLLSVGILAGRVYEILSLTDWETGFLITKGIALNPVLLAIFVLITVCCGVLIWGGEKNTEPFFSKSSGIIADLAGVAFVAFGVMQFSESRAAVLMIVGGAALLLLGITKLGGKPKDAVIVIMLTAFVAGLCLDIIIFDVYSVYYTEFMHRVLSYTSVVLLLLAVLKNVYAPSKNSRMLLYVSGFICFAFSGMFSIAQIICSFATGQEFTSDTVKNIAFVLMGIYALDNALSVLPKNKAETEDNPDGKTAEIEEKTESEIIKEFPKEEKVQHTEEIRKMLYTTENGSSEKQSEKSVVAKNKRVFKGEKTASSRTEKIVYKKPKD